LSSSSSSKPLVVEFIGATGVGKSTLLPAVAEFLSAQGLRVRLADEAILARWGLALPNHPGVRSAVVLLLALPPFALFLLTRKGRRLSWLALRAIVRGMGSTWIGAKLLGNFVKRIGSHFLLERVPNDRLECDLVLCDEGVVHAAHNLFVHVRCGPRESEVVQFGRLVPRPDLLVWVTAPAEQSAAVIVRRGHSRVPAGPAAALAFAEHARAAFEMLSGVEGLQEKTYRVDNTAEDGTDDGQAIRARASAIGEFLQQRLRERVEGLSQPGPANSLSLRVMEAP
jgi:energy-coupling factor transporter ATP-binding protein EcfA2